MNESSSELINATATNAAPQIPAVSETAPVAANQTPPEAPPIVAPEVVAQLADTSPVAVPQIVAPMPNASAVSQPETPAETSISVDGLVAAGATETSAQTPVLAPPATPPRALTPGAFLRGEIEVKTVVSRGLTNIYEAAMGDYGAMQPILLAEREIAPQAAANNSTEAEPPNVTWQTVDTSVPEPSSATSSTRSAETSPAANATNTNATNINATNANATIENQGFENAHPNDILTVDETAESGAFIEDVDTLPNEEITQIAPAENSEVVANAPLSNTLPTNQTTVNLPNVNHFASPQVAATQVETPALEYAKEIETPTLDEAATLFVAGETFEQEGREYKILNHFASTALQDWREPTNDERLLKMLHAVAQGLTELERSRHRAQFTTETLRVDANGDLKFLGFVEGGAFDALGELRRVARFLLKQTFAESATMRLDDQYGALAFSEELKTIARRLDASDDNAFSTLQEAAATIAPYASSTRLRADFALATDVGQEREINEDSGLIVTQNRQATLNTREWELYVVADGMGGHEGGEVASDLTLTSLVRNLEAQAIDFNDNVAVKNALISVIDAVNAEVVALTETPKYKGTRAKPGSTLTFGLRVGARVFVGNVGDSRAYKYANRVLERVSKDHSYVQTLIDSGEISEEEAFTHPDGSVITAHIGYPKLKQRDVFLRLFRAGETLLLVSDGVTDMLRDAEYAAHLAHEHPDDVCRAFVDAANAAGGADNITVVCVKFR